MLHDLKKYNQSTPIWPSDFCIDGKEVYFFHGSMNALLKYDLNSEHAEMLTVLPDEPMLREFTICTVLKYGKDIFMIPAWGQDIAVYNQQTRKCKVLNLPERQNYSNRLTFSNAFIVEDNIFCIPDSYHSIIKVNVHTKEIEYLFSTTSFFKDYFQFDNVSINASVYDGKENIYCIITGTNKLMVYNIEKNEAEIISVGNDGSIFSTINYIDGKLYLSDYLSKAFDRKVFIYDINTKEVEIICNIPYDGFAIHALQNGDYMVDSFYNGGFMIFNENNKLIFEQGNTERVYGGDLNYSYHYGIVRHYGNKYIYYNRHNNELWIVNDRQIEKKVIIHAEDIDNHIEISSIYGRYIIENGIFNLAWLVSGLGGAE
ncbi:MAG: hypothetical protein IJ661_04565 [Lachnospiraceae bacterium]|nr:hypothetical protein [Lachnospiraceae bacterium]